MIELLILVAVAAFVLLRLKSVIGTRTGYEAPPEHRAPGYDNGAPAAETQRAEPPAEEMALRHALSQDARDALMAMRAAEPDFSLDDFLEGARSAYEMVLMAFEEGDRQTLQNLLTPDVYRAFESVIATREAEGLKVEARFIGVRDIRVETASFDPETSEADVTLRFVGEMITAVRDPENRIVEGDPNEIRRQTDVWTFSRVMGAPNPNWLLSATGD
ncbi:Tim44/TimA family putative adaptor protein [Limibaculum sp. FT325]|uniref:Tim44/TimA family putative adaptor protein n=1 Tax=Thermohalobaculum sediminis TaxID=2939436 RepID=UPI0020BE1CB0|nr:Tim44/TimA family putative adaptor protein [Limibaculum sediminis]MCL5776641.1 Tim44/TimA family putative adaptor protein [Limibaculum sediminis]